MAAIDPSQFKALHKYFPALTLTQLATAYMYSTGIPVGTIAQLRDVSEDTVKDSLKAACNRMQLTSISTMGTAIQLKLNLELLTAIDSIHLN